MENNKLRVKLSGLKKMVESNYGNNIAQDLGISNFHGYCVIMVVDRSDVKHPTTGDLSVFTALSSDANESELHKQ